MKEGKNYNTPKPNFKKSLNNVFLQYGENVCVPDELEIKVFKSLDKIFLAADVIDLFCGKFIGAETTYLGGLLNELESDSVKDL